MSSLRKILDSWDGMKKKIISAPPALKVNDQVVMRKVVGNRGPVTKEVLVGTVAALSGSTATVTIPRPGGRLLRACVPVGDLQPVSSVYGRNAVQINAALRQIYKGSA